MCVRDSKNILNTIIISHKSQKMSHTNDESKPFGKYVKHAFFFLYIIKL